MSVHHLLTSICALAICGMSQFVLPSGRFVSSGTLAHIRGGDWCEYPEPVESYCFDCMPLDDPPTKWGECNGSGPSKECQAYINLNFHYGTDCRDGNQICDGVRYEYSIEGCEGPITNYPPPGCHDGVPFVRTYQADYVGNAGPIGACTF